MTNHRKTNRIRAWSPSRLKVFYTETKRKACLTIENKWNSGMAPLSFLKVFYTKSTPTFGTRAMRSFSFQLFFDGGPCFPGWLSIKTLRNEAEPCPNSKGGSVFHWSGYCSSTQCFFIVRGSALKCGQSPHLPF